MNKKLVSLDVGIKYIGVATTDPLWNFPVILGTLLRKQSIVDDLERLLEMLEKIEVAGFVIGFPFTIDGSEGSISPMIRGFEKRLKELFPTLPFFRVDESFSSKEAIEIKNITGRNYKKNKKSGKIDSTAAAVILQRFMETKEFENLKAETIFD
ncbi:MAG: Holliday junction resolvase RuvX [bacterium]